MMEPTTIVGAVLGSFLNKVGVCCAVLGLLCVDIRLILISSRDDDMTQVLPELVVSILLVVVLGALAHRTLKKGTCGVVVG